MLADNVPAYRLDVMPERGRRHRSSWLPSWRRSSRCRRKTSRASSTSASATRGFRPVTLKLRVDEEEAARFAVDRWRFPGVELRALPQPPLSATATLFAHVDRLRRPHRRRRPQDARRRRRGADPHRQDRPRALLRGRAARQGRLRAGRDQRRGPRAAPRRPRAGDAGRGPAAERSTPTCSRRWSPRSATRTARRWRSIRAPAKCWRWSACRATTPTCSSTASRTPTTAR